MEIITNLDQAMSPAEASVFKHGLKHYIDEEKAMTRLRQIKTAKIEREKGARSVEGLGQLIGVVDSRNYFRWLQEDPDFWRDGKNIDKFLKDNEQCAVPRFGNK
jgi:hypothetical protein